MTDKPIIGHATPIHHDHALGLPSRIDAFAEQAKQALTQAIAERDQARGLANEQRKLIGLMELERDAREADKAELLEVMGEFFDNRIFRFPDQLIIDQARALITKHSGAGETG